MKIYNSIHTCPIYNYFDGVIATNDLRYLLVLDDYSELPGPNEETFTYEKLQIAWEKINNEFEAGTLDLTLLRLKYQAWLSYHNYKVNKSFEQKCNTDFAKYRKEFEKGCNDFVITDQTIERLYYDLQEKEVTDQEIEMLHKLLDFKGIVYKSMIDLYNDLKTQISYLEILNIRLYLCDYVEYKRDDNYSLSDELANIELILKLPYQIDRMKMTLSQYMSKKKQVKIKIKNEKANKEKNRAS